MHVRISEVVSSYKLNWFVCTWFRDDQQQQLILIDVLPVGPWSWVIQIVDSAEERLPNRTATLTLLLTLTLILIWWRFNTVVLLYCRLAGIGATYDDHLRLIGWRIGLPISVN